MRATISTDSTSNQTNQSKNQSINQSMNRSINQQDDDAVPIYSNLSSIYTDVHAAKARFSAVASRFHAIYGANLSPDPSINQPGVPTFYVRAPGRVNLIGEHIDYCGFSVLPMAIDRDTVIACTINQSIDQSVDQPIQLANFDPAYEAVTFQDNKETFLINQSTNQSKVPFWAKYFQCGFKGVFEAVKKTGDTSILTDEQPIDQSINDADFYAYRHHSLSLLVSGTVPPSAGLSSSSSLVCASALCAAFAHGFVKTNNQSINQSLDQSVDQTDESINQSIKFTKKQMAELCCSSERYIGTMGGGMDQSISFLSQSGVAQLIDFNPLTNQSINLPKNAVFVVCNSLYESSKAINADSQFNQRVVECKLAALILYIHYSQVMKQPINLSINQSNNACFQDLTLKKVLDLTGLSLEKMINRLNDPATCPLQREPYTVESINQFLINQSINQSINQLMGYNAKFMSVLSTGCTFRLYDRTMHVYTEAARVHQFKDLCNQSINQSISQSDSSTLVELGRLMSASHLSCDQLYDCSCSDLNYLVDVLISAGACGARLTGAGWGGCTVALFDGSKGQHAIQQAMEIIKQKYYVQYKHLDTHDPKIEEYLFLTKPSNGASIYVPPAQSINQSKTWKSHLIKWSIILSMGMITGLIGLSMTSRRAKRNAHIQGHTTAGTLTGLTEQVSTTLPMIK